jgi:hypothetical protein
MRLHHWFRNLLALPRTGQFSPSPSPRRGPPQRRRVAPRLEVLEDRTVPSPIMVSNKHDSGAGSLRAAVTTADANPGSTIDFAAGLHGTITLSGPLDITSSTTINGPGANILAVSGAGTYQIFDISGSADVSISGLTLTDGLATAGGAVLLQGSAALNLSVCTLTDNVALGNASGGGFGGAIEDTSSGALTVANSTFDNNKAVGVGPNNPTPGYVLALGGAIDVGFTSSGPSTISNSTFTGNEALGGSPGASGGGGAISNSNFSEATMTVTDCTLTDNAAIGAAGGDGEVNFGTGQGGGINNFANLTVVHSTFADNLAQGEPMVPGAVPSQTAVSDGSGVAGGGIFCLPGIPTETASATVIDSTFTGNQAVGGAGANGDAAVQGGAGSPGSVGEGGGVAFIASSGLVDGCTFTDNVARGGAGGNGVGGAASGVGAPGGSGGIDLAFGSVVTVSNTTLIHNEAIGGAGGAGATGGNGVGGGINDGSGVLFGDPTDNCSLTLSDAIFIGNQAVGGAGGSGSNGGNGWGGGLSVLAGDSAGISASALVGNLAQGGPGGAGGSDGEGIGGGVYDLGTLTELEALIVANLASTSNDNIYP